MSITQRWAGVVLGALVAFACDAATTNDGNGSNTGGDGASTSGSSSGGAGDSGGTSSSGGGDATSGNGSDDGGNASHGGDDAGGATSSGEGGNANDNGGTPSGGGGNDGGNGGSDGVAGADTGPVAEAPPGCDDLGAASDSNGTTPGETSLPFPTLEHLTVLWLIEGDDDLDGAVTLRFRESGGEWRAGMPLRRVPAGEVEGFGWQNKHAGSLFGLEPGTAYEVELALRDPDGGCETRSLEATTRSVPVPMANAPVIPATPDDVGDMLDGAEPGDVIELAAGSYGELQVTVDGEPGAPIVLRGTDGAVLEGDLRLDGRSHVIVENVEVHGQIKFNDSSHLAIIGCTVEANENGIVTQTRSENLYIADNVVTGVTIWAEASLGVDGDNLGEGILVTGPGHVIEHNRVSGFRDGISLLEDEEASDQYSIDILRNEISEAADDGIEADFCFHDCRILGNRLTNTFIALSSQPGLGGPTYFVRNVVLNTILSAFKLQRGSVGDVGLHNTVVKTGDAFGIYTEDVFSRQYFRNNLFLGGEGAEWNGYSSGEGRVLSLEAAGDAVDLDYDGYGSVAGFSGRIGETRFESLAELRSLTTEAHAVEVDLSVFAEDVSLDGFPFPGTSPTELSLANGSAAIDAALPIQNINDGFAGDAPDLGALEFGTDAPVVGPRR